jgi:hypothetical protein
MDVSALWELGHLDCPPRYQILFDFGRKDALLKKKNLGNIIHIGIALKVVNLIDLVYLFEIKAKLKEENTVIFCTQQ